jgi:hypothetical protein
MLLEGCDAHAVLAEAMAPEGDDDHLAPFAISNGLLPTSCSMSPVDAGLTVTTADRILSTTRLTAPKNSFRISFMGPFPLSRSAAGHGEPPQRPLRNAEKVRIFTNLPAKVSISFCALPDVRQVRLVDATTWASKKGRIEPKELGVHVS